MRVNDIGYYIRQAKRKGLSFVFQRTLFTTKLITEKDTYTFTKSTGLRAKELNLIRRVKMDAEKFNKDIPVYHSKDIQFIAKSNKLKGVAYTSELYEIDLSSAYWEEAFKVGIISKDTYEYAHQKDVRKKARLIALGALAKKVYTTNYDGQQYSKPIILEGSKSHLFYYCSYQTLAKMHLCKIIAGKGFFFLWCDAIFVQGKDNFNRIVNYLDSEVIKHKIIPLEKILIRGNEIVVYSEAHERKERIFNFHKQGK